MASFGKICCRCALTVRGVIASRSAICLLLIPDAARTATRLSCGVNTIGAATSGRPPVTPAASSSASARVAHGAAPRN